MTSDFLDAWRRLQSVRPRGDDQAQTETLIIGATETALRLAVDGPGMLHLLVPAVGPSARRLPPDFNGLRLREGTLDGELCLDLSSPPAHENMFAALCSELATAIVSDQREPWAAAIAIVRAWQAAFRPVRQPMSRPVQVGLIGELFILDTLWIPALGPDAIFLWSGPDRERHDFVGPSLHMEVKTTTKSRGEHEISRVDQLQSVQGRRLILASIQIEDSAMGTHTVGTFVDKIIRDLAGDPSSQDAFLTKLDGLDWNEEMNRSPDLVRCHIRAAQLFEVDDEFPQLPPDFGLPDGVLSIRYTISLANLPYLDTQAVRDELARMASEIRQLV